MTNDLIIPTKESLAKWGVLAYVTDEDRKNIMALPAGMSKVAVQMLEQRVREFAKKTPPSGR